MILRPSQRPADPPQPSAYALLVDSMEDEHELSVVQGVLSAARELGARILCLPGGPVDSPEPRLQARNFVFDLIGPENTLGALVLSSAIGNAIGPVRLGAWLSRYDSLPLCSVGVPIQGLIGVRVDNGGGIRAAVLHLIEVHGRRNIGFIRGPSQSEEAEVRFLAYQAALKEHGIQYDPRWVAEGDYNQPSGAQAVRTILDQKRVSVHSLDGLVCANDYMALGALEELTRRGINVPEQIALTGFDDVASAAAARPPLTTVRQPGGELGRTGVKQLLLLAGGGTPVADHVLTVQLTVRLSCGCAKQDSGLAQRVHALPTTGSFEAALVQRRQVLVAEMARAARGSLGAAGKDWEGGLINALLEELSERKYGALMRRTQRLLQRQTAAEGDPNAVPDVLAALRLQALPCVIGHPDARSSLEEAIQEAQMAVTIMLRQVAVARERTPTRRLRALVRQVQELMFGEGAELSNSLSRVLASQLPEMGVDACIVASCNPKGPEPWQGRTRFGFGPGGRTLEPKSLDLRTLQAHALLEHSKALFLLPITRADEQLGIMMLSANSLLAGGDGTLLEELRELFATVLKVARERGRE